MSIYLSLSIFQDYSGQTYITITIAFKIKKKNTASVLLDIIQYSLFYLNHDVSQIGFFPRNVEF